MSPKSRLERLRVQMGEAAARFAEDSAKINNQKQLPPRLGDTFLFKDAGAAPLEWVAIEQDPADLRRLLVVPADDNPSIGSRDVAVSAGAIELTSIRCDWGVWLDDQTLDPERRTGVLNLEVVNQVRRKRDEIQAGRCVGSLLEQEVDEDPDYQEWREVLAAEREVLDRLRLSATADSSRRATDRSPTTAATSIRQELTSLRQRLEDALRLVPQLNLPFHHFVSVEPVRGPDKPLTIRASAKRIALIFEVAEPEPYSHYRLEILEKDTRQEIWADDRLTRVGSELSLDLPRSLFSSGSYVFRIYGLEEKEKEFLEEYTLAVDLE